MESTKEIAEKFDSDLKFCLDLIDNHKDEEAKEFFNTKILDIYHMYVYGEGKLSGFISILQDLGEYFNNPNARDLDLYTTRRSYIITIDKEDEYVELLSNLIK